MTAAACRRVDGPLHPFGFGLSYTSFEVADVAITVMHEGGQQARHDDGGHAFAAGSVVNVKVAVHNSGSRTGAWPVLVKVQDDACIVPPAGAMLKRFQRVQLGPGESAALHFTVCLCQCAAGAACSHCSNVLLQCAF